MASNSEGRTGAAPSSLVRDAEGLTRFPESCA